MVELHDDEARQLGAVLGGAYERPKIVEELEMALGEFQIEWIKVPTGSWVNGRTLSDVRVPQADGRDRDRDPPRVGVDRRRPAGRRDPRRATRSSSSARRASSARSSACSPSGPTDEYGVGAHTRQ